MGRRIIAKNLQSGISQEKVDGYQERLLKYIPADINAIWIFVTGIVKSDNSIPQSTALWIVFVILLILTPFWIWHGTKESKKPVATTQIIVSTVAFFVWVFALGEPFSTSFKDFYRPGYGSILLAFYTLIVAKIVPAEE